VHAVACPKRDWKQPVAIAQHGGLVQRAAIGKAHRCGPFWLGGVGIIKEFKSALFFEGFNFKKLTLSISFLFVIYLMTEIERSDVY
jgi:hypothetical protein